MQVGAEEIWRLYRECCEEYHRTDFGARWPYVPNDFALLQLKKIVHYLPDSAVFVDIGTCSGIAPRFVKKLGVRSISVDFPVTASYETIRVVRLAGVEGYYYEVGREPIPVEDASVDLVLIADVVEHLPHSPKPVLAEIYRILKPGGVCLATTVNATRLTVRLKVLLGYSNWPYVFDYYDKDYHEGHHHEYTREEFREIFRRADFVEEEFILYEKILRYARVAEFGNLQSRRRVGDKTTAKADKSHWLINWARFALLGVTDLFPGRRSAMFLVTRKP